MMAAGVEFYSGQGQIIDWNDRVRTFRSKIFRGEQDFAWDILDAECRVHTPEGVTLNDIMHLTQLYMKLIERLNSLQDPRQHYFTHKMTKLMAKPHVVKVLNVQQADGKKAQRENRRIEMQELLSLETQKKQPLKLQLMIQEQKQKQAKLNSTIASIIEKQDSRLERRLKARALLKPRSIEELLSKDCPTEDRDREQEFNSPNSAGKRQGIRKVSSEIFDGSFT